MDPFDHERLYGPLYSDTGYFVRGRPGIYADPNPQSDTARIATNVAVWIVFPAVVWLAIALVIIHALLPSVR